jgi:hypothetical protein
MAPGRDEPQMRLRTLIQSLPRTFAYRNPQKGFITDISVVNGFNIESNIV